MIVEAAQLGEYLVRALGELASDADEDVPFARERGADLPRYFPFPCAVIADDAVITRDLVVRVLSPGLGQWAGNHGRTEAVC
jgi:hypothetical protein